VVEYKNHFFNIFSQTFEHFLFRLGRYTHTVMMISILMLCLIALGLVKTTQGQTPTNMPSAAPSSAMPTTAAPSTNLFVFVNLNLQMQVTGCPYNDFSNNATYAKTFQEAVSISCASTFISYQNVSNVLATDLPSSSGLTNLAVSFSIQAVGKGINDNLIVNRMQTKVRDEISIKQKCLPYYYYSNTDTNILSPIQLTHFNQTTYAGDK